MLNEAKFSLLFGEILERVALTYILLHDYKEFFSLPFLQHEFDILGDDDIPCLSERVKNTPPSKTKPATLLSKKPAAAKLKSKAKHSDSDDSGSDVDVPAHPPLKRAHPTRTRTVKSYAIVLDSDEDKEEAARDAKYVSDGDDDEFKLSGEDSGDEFPPPPKKTSKLAFTTISHPASKEPKAKSKPRSKATGTTKSLSKAASKTGHKPVSKADSKPASEANSKPASEVDSKPTSEADSKPASETEPKPAAKAVPKKSAGATKKAVSKPKGKLVAKQPQKTLKQMMESLDRDTEEPSLCPSKQSQKTVFDLTASDSEFKEVAHPKKPVHKPRGRPKPKTIPKEVSSGSEVEAIEPASKKALPKPKGKAAPKRTQKFVLSDSESEEEATVPAPSTKAGTLAQSKVVIHFGGHFGCQV